MDSIRLAILKQSGTNTVDVARAVKDEIAKINEDMPQLKMVILRDSSDYIQRSITNVGYSALHGGLLSIVILLIFLRNIRSTMVVAIAIPISIIATFGLMYFTGFTLNIMTMGGLALGIGRLVDDSIVVLENIYRRKEAGESPEAGRDQRQQRGDQRRDRQHADDAGGVPAAGVPAGHGGGDVQAVGGGGELRA